MEDLSSRCMSVLLDFSFILIFGSTYLDAKYPISRWILLPTIFMESAFLHSENTQTCNTKILDFGLAKGVATAIFSTAGTGFDKKIEGRTENMTPERPSITPISYLIMQASHDIQVHKSPQTLACK
ncbi:uncharacterized protein LOC113284192 isoform X4 [Papaver somniferum]|uniref:uncharacterized protein LOC113284192 isoform X4 n=1 Tax=Papaver somniferum TaxID=3469 RepID=UPI000E6F6435|nr:uncharacterized protein LOC113284192 isoform X4 [Papaver somniferum]